MTQPPPLRRRQRSSPPPQDKLVLIFILASALFAILSLTPLILLPDRTTRLLPHTNSHPITHRSNSSYVTFEPDHGGWNNIRMSLEIVSVFAAATGRTLVLPPDAPLYLLTRGEKYHGIGDFIDVGSTGMGRELRILSMEEFLQRGPFALPRGRLGETVDRASRACVHLAKSDRSCESLYAFLRSVAHVPKLHAANDCLIFDSGGNSSEEVRERVDRFCLGRTPTWVGDELAMAPHVHFHSGDKNYRLLNHFYTFVMFTDPVVDRYYKRFVRDSVHYVDAIFGAAEGVVRELGGVGTYSAMHIRRGDFQYKKVKLSAEEWLNATMGVLQPGEVVYVATDERNRSFFQPLGERYELRFLEEFEGAAGLGGLDPNYAGMIDTVVASRGRIFFGTWFSTFTGYINRLRGYYGMPGNSSYYGQPEHRYCMHAWEDPHNVLTAREWPTGWVGIDDDSHFG